MTDAQALTPLERAVWDEWSRVPDGCASPVRTVARALAMEPADVAFIVYPARPWRDDQERELDA